MNLTSQLQSAAQAGKALAEIIEAARTAAGPEDDELAAKLAQGEAGRKLDLLVAAAANLESRVAQIAVGSESVQNGMLEAYLPEVVADLRLLVFGTAEINGLWPYDAESREQFIQVYWDKINDEVRSLYNIFKERAKRS